MNEAIHSIVQQIFGKSTLAECTVPELETLVQRHPYFATAQVLLLQKLKEENAPGYEAQMQKAVLYYPDPLAFELMVNSGPFYGNSNTAVEVNEDDHGPFQQATETEQTEVQMHQTGLQHQGEAELVILGAPEEIAQEEERPAPEEGSTATGYQNESQAAINEAVVPVINEEQEENAASAMTEISNIPDGQEDPEEDFTTEFVSNEPVTEPDAMAIAAVATDHSLHDANNDVVADVAPGANEQTTEEEIRLPAFAIDLNAPVSDKAPTFEPFHTVDYFASVGIKLNGEEPKDKFGRQLKSFTEWLKAMKKIPASEVASPEQARTEEKVQHLAQGSIHHADVYTEAMAEVWLKQGNVAKAIDVYQKLSLLNPSKMAYFAHKIDNLKRS